MPIEDTKNMTVVNQRAQKTMELYIPNTGELVATILQNLNLQHHMIKLWEGTKNIQEESM